jgi:hypothetical protein
LIVEKIKIDFMRNLPTQKIVMLLLVLFLTSCSLLRRMENDSGKIQAQRSDVILFLVFKISKDSVQNKNVIEPVSQDQSPGQIKAEPDSPNEFEDYLTVEVFEQNRRANVIIVEHPLRKHIEYVDDHGMLASKLVELDQAEFFIRVQLTGNSAKIRISETLKNTVRRELKTFKL